MRLILKGSGTIYHAFFSPRLIIRHATRIAARSLGGGGADQPFISLYYYILVLLR